MFTTPSWGKAWISDARRAIMSTPRGEVPEWLNGAVSKTVVVLWATVGSNPTLSARKGRPIFADALYASSMTPTKNFPTPKDPRVNNPSPPYTHIHLTGQTTMAFEQIEIATFNQRSR